MDNLAHPLLLRDRVKSRTVCNHLICSTQYAADQARYTSGVSCTSRPFDATDVSDLDLQGVTETLGAASRRTLTCPPRIRYPGSYIGRDPVMSLRQRFLPPSGCGRWLGLLTPPRGEARTPCGVRVRPLELRKQTFRKLQTYRGYG